MLGLFVVVAFAVAAGEPAASVWVLLVLVAYAVCRGWLVWRRVPGLDGVTLAALGARLGLVACLAACACAVQLVPLAESLGESAVFRERLVHGTPALTPGAWPHVVFAKLPSGSPASFAGLLTLLCAVLAPFCVRERKAVAFFAALALAWIALAWNVLGAWTFVQSLMPLRLVPIESGFVLFHFALAALAALFVHHVLDRGAHRHVSAAVGTLCAALTLLFVARAGVARLVMEFVRPPATAADARWIEATTGLDVYVAGCWFAAGAALLALAWFVRGRFVRHAVILGAVAALVLLHAGPVRHALRATQAPRSDATIDPIEVLACRAGAERLIHIGHASRDAALEGSDSPTPPETPGLARVDDLRRALFEVWPDGTDVRWTTLRGLQLFGIERVRSADDWPAIDTWTGFVARDSRAEYLTSPLVPDAAVELDFRLPHEHVRAIRVCFETGGRPLLQNIGLEVVDRATNEPIAARVIEPDFERPNSAARVYGVLELPRLADWKTRKLRLIVRSNDGVSSTAWSLVARTDWLTVMNQAFWRRDGVRTLPVALGHAEFRGYACRQFERKLRGSIVVDMTWNAEKVVADGHSTWGHEFPVRPAVPPFRTVSRAVAATDAADALAQVLHPDFDPVRTVVLEGAAGGSAPGAEDAPVRIAAHDARSVHLETRRTAPGWLVTSVPWHPGWRATVNGVEQPILRANYAFSAVRLGAGESRIVLAHDPRSAQLGAWISITALLAFAAWLIGSRGSGLSRDARAS
jgi:hypothetical protein